MPVAEPPGAQDRSRSSEGPQWEDYARCIHCGLCLNHCPTYRLWGREADSPRGRIRQMLLVDQGQLRLGERFVQHMDRCLDCRACETACPAGVEYGRLIEAARARIEQHYRRPWLERAWRRLFFRTLLPHPQRIAQVARLLRFYQRSGLQRLVRASGLLHLLGVAERERLLPPVDDEFFFSCLGRTFPPLGGRRRARVAFFAGCVAQVLFARLNRATIRVLQANGCEVVVPAGQRCCGALAVHAGVRDVARELAVTNLQAFSVDGFDALVTNAAGCGATLKEYAHLFPLSERARAGAFAARVRDVTEFLAELGLSAPLREVRLRVTFQDSCHLLHGQRIGEAPRRLIRSVPGVELVEMHLADSCCGSAGIYNLTQTEAAFALLREKMGYVRATGADAVLTANPGCMLQLRAGVDLFANDARDPAARPIEVLHVMELLDRARAKD
ncbi:MAG: (Fe-S)-binding protein [Firmicutes bacterium]|nr:(Fe-S)-binding protein [Bacillota bacterium]